MLSSNDIAKIYDTVLSIPGMNDSVKIVLNIPRKNVLLLTKIIERGLTAKDEQAAHSLLTVVGPDTISAMQQISTDLLQKSGLTDMNEKLNAFQTKS